MRAIVEWSTDRAMLHRVTHILLYIFPILHYSCTFGQILLPNENEKLPGSATLEMCIESFDIHKDKIIRTQDSQRMGAKYLNEVDLESRQECLRLCCQTDECDVFIFEEKKPGSCYLFHCGPPHDFKCKFTSHANYSSAVLTNINYRSTTRLEEQIRRTQQEHELKSLRKLAEAAPLEYSYTEAPLVPVTEVPRISVLTAAQPVKRGCSRNQYECRTSGDCIAIYNVCDGISQCTDGSDEASELGCPTERPAPTIPSLPVIHAPLVPQASEILKYPPLIPHHKSYAPIYSDEPEPNAPKLWQFPVAPHRAMGQQSPNAPYPGRQQVDTSVPQINYGSPGYNIANWDYRPMYEKNNKEAPYNAANPLHVKHELPSYEPDEPRIFKHKNTGVVAQSAGPQGAPYIDSNRAYGSGGFYYPLKNHGAWQEGEPRSPSHLPQSQSLSPPKVQHEGPTATEQQPESTTALIPCKPPTTDLVKDSSKADNTEIKVYETLKTSHADTGKTRETTKLLGDEYPKDSREKTRIDTNQVSDRNEIQHKNKTPEVHNHANVKIHHTVAEHLGHKNTREDVDVLRPKGAVISLALGLSATAIMAALIACRLRVVRRRARRGHGPYAHDADYLVNGMYL